MKEYTRITTKRFRKDIKVLTKAGNDLSTLQDVIDILATGGVLSEKYRDHPLHGKLQGTRECHIGPDWLLRYAKDKDALILLLISTGDHRHVLGME